MGEIIIHQPVVGRVVKTIAQTPQVSDVRAETAAGAFQRRRREVENHHWPIASKQGLRALENRWLGAARIDFDYIDLAQSEPSR